MSSSSIGYLPLLRRNRNFRRLWYGQVVSQLGDWLDSIALFTLLLTLTGSSGAVGLLFVAEFLPGAIVGPFAGVIIDRLPRRLVLIASDIGRGLLVLLLLFVRGPQDVWLVYLVITLKVALSAFFEPARSAIVPSLCAREELVAANAISGVTWSAMLAIGAALGGLVAGTLGVTASFILDAGSFFLSAVLIATVRVDEGRKAEETSASPGGSRQKSAVAQVFAELREGLAYVVTHHEVFWLAFTKALWSMSGGVMLLLTLFGRELFPIGRDGALSIGLLYAARGVGTAIGPILALRIFGDGATFMRRATALAFFISALGYFGFSGASSLPLAMLMVLFAHTGGSIEWVFSTALLQQRVPNLLLGRVFAVEYAGFTLATALSGYLTGYAGDMGFTPRALAVALSGIFVITGTTLTIALWRAHADVAGETARI